MYNIILSNQKIMSASPSIMRLRMRFQKILSELSTRVTLLEWQLKELHPSLLGRLPKGVFRHSHVENTAVLIDELKADIHALTVDENIERGQYLSQMLTHKINILVKMCQLQKKYLPKTQQSSMTLQGLMTRQTWLSSLATEIQKLEEAEAALLLQIQQSSAHSLELALEMRKSHADVLKQLTELRETYQREVG